MSTFSIKVIKAITNYTLTEKPSVYGCFLPQLNTSSSYVQILHIFNKLETCSSFESERNLLHSMNHLRGKTLKSEELSTLQQRRQGERAGG